LSLVQLGYLLKPDEVITLSPLYYPYIQDPLGGTMWTKWKIDSRWSFCFRHIPTLQRRKSNIPLSSVMVETERDLELGNDR